MSEKKPAYDSYADSIEHIQNVQGYIADFLFALAAAGVDHDISKLVSPEKELFDEWSPKLAELTYGSDEYKNALKQLGSALEHHYQENSHHPEHYENGIDGMDLIDLVEMLCDWKAATERHNDGDIKKSLEINKDRFNISDQLYSILSNTVNLMGW